MENFSTTVTGAARMVKQLKIEGFSATGCKDDTEYTASRWSVGGYDWEVRIYPSSRDCVELDLVFLAESCTSVPTASLCCQVIDPMGQIEPSQEKSQSEKFYHAKVHSPLVCLMSRADLLTSGYLRGDTLTVRCAVTVLKELLTVPIIREEEAIAPPPSNLHRHFGEILESEMGANITLVVGGESFAAHKIILAARSPVFKAQFFGDMKEKCTRRVEIKDMDAEVFRALLRFIYTDTVPELDQPIEAVAAMAQHLLVAADRYGLDRLRLICEMKLTGGRGITVDTAATTLALTEQHHFLRLKANCLEFIVSTDAVLEAVWSTEGFKHLQASCPLVVLDLVKAARGRKSLKRSRWSREEEHGRKRLKLSRGSCEEEP